MSSAGTVTEVKGAPPHVHHMDVPTAYQSAKLGMWLFLATEVLLFGGLFTAFAIYRYVYFGEFQSASINLDWRMGAINTAFLIFSSLTAALAMDAAQRGDNAKVRRNIAITILCGFVFLVVKYFEYKGKAHYGLFPGGEAGFRGFIQTGTGLFALGLMSIAVFTGSKSATGGTVFLGSFVAFSLVTFFAGYFSDQAFQIALFASTIMLAIIAVRVVARSHQEAKGLKIASIGFAVVLFIALFVSADYLSVLHFDIAKLFPGYAHHPETAYTFNSPEFNEKYKSYYGLYYCMTGLHALHVVLGMGILFWVYIKASADRFSEKYYTPVELGALYWHLVDLIWIYLFPLLYLVD